MKRWIILAAAGAAAFGIATVLAPVSESWAAPDPTTKTVTLVCKPGWRSSAVGQYGGVGFSVQCNNGHGVEKIKGASGTAYGVRMGVESATGAFDCAFSGDAPTVNETCAEVRLTIR